MKILYILPQKSFFSDGHGGRVSHAKGLIDGFVQNNCQLTVIAEAGINDYVKIEDEFFSIKEIPRSLNEINFVKKSLSFISDEYDLILIRKNLLTLLYLVFSKNFWRSKIFSKKIVWEINGLSFETKRHTFFGNLLFKFSLAIQQILLKKSNLIYVVSPILKKELSSGIFKIESSQILVIPNGSPKIPSKFIYDSSEIPYKFLFFGKLQPYNDYKILFEAFSLLREKYDNYAQLHIVGYGNEEKVIIDLIKNNPNTYFHGSMDIDKLAQSGILNNKSIGVIPLKNVSGANLLSPIKLFDYYSLGLPVIISDIVNLPANLEKCNLLVYSNNNLESLADCLEYYLLNVETLKSRKKYFLHQSLVNSWTNRVKDLLTKFNA